MTKKKTRIECVDGFIRIAEDASFGLNITIENVRDTSVWLNHRAVKRLRDSLNSMDETGFETVKLFDSLKIHKVDGIFYLELNTYFDSNKITIGDSINELRDFLNSLRKSDSLFEIGGVIIKLDGDKIVIDSPKSMELSYFELGDLIKGLTTVYESI